MLCMDEVSPPREAPALVAAGARQVQRPGSFKGDRGQNETAALRRTQAAAIECRIDQRSAVAKTVGGAFPLRYVVGDHAGGFHRGLAELGIAGDLALDALAFGMQQVAQASSSEIRFSISGERGAGDALDQRVDVVDGSFLVRLEREVGAARRMPGAGRRR